MNSSMSYSNDQMQSALLQNKGFDSTSTRESLENELTLRFGQPAVNKNIRADPRSEVKVTANTLSELMGNNGETISHYISDKISDPFIDWMYQIFPGLWTDHQSISVFFAFDVPGIARPTAEFGRTRRVQTKSTSIFKQMGRVGLGLEMALDVFLAPGGMATYQRKVNQIVQGHLRLTYVSFMDALLTAKHTEKEHALLRPLFFSAGTLSKLQKTNFCATCFGDSDFVMRNLYNGAASKIENSTGFRPNFMIIGPNTQNRVIDKASSAPVIFISQSKLSPELIEVVSKHPVPRAFPDEVSIYVDKGITYGSTDAPPSKSLENLTHMVEHAIAGMETVKNVIDTNEGERFTTKKLNIGMTQMDRNGGGEFVSMDFIEMLENTFLWGNVREGAHGSLGWMEDEMHGGNHSNHRGDIYDDNDNNGMNNDRQHRFSIQTSTSRFQDDNRRFTSTNNTRNHLSNPSNSMENFLKYKDETSGSSKYVTTIGQISQIHLPKDVLAEYATHLKLVLYDTLEQFRIAEHGLRSYLQLMRCIESQTPSKLTANAYFKDLIEQNISASFNINKEFAGRDVNGVTSYKTNELGGWDLPVRKTDLNLRYPLGFNNPAGILVIDAQGAEAGWADAAKLAAPAAEFIRDFYKKVSDHMTSSTAVKKDLCPPQYQDGLKGAYTLATLITKHRPSLWVPIVNPKIATPVSALTGDVADKSLKQLEYPLHIISAFASNVSPGFLNPNQNRFYSTNTNKYVVRVAPFVIEVAGLSGSKYFVIPYIPLVIANSVPEFNLGRRALIMSKLGGKTITLFSHLIFALNTESLTTLLENVLQHIAKFDKPDFKHLRAVVYGLSQIPVNQNNTELIAVITGLNESNTSKPTSSAIKEKAKVIIKKFYDGYKNIIESDKSSDNRYWIEMYSDNAKTVLKSKPGIVIKELFSRILERLHLFSNKILKQSKIALYPKSIFHNPNVDSAQGFDDNTQFTESDADDSKNKGFIHLKIDDLLGKLVGQLKTLSISESTTNVLFGAPVVEFNKLSGEPSAQSTSKTAEKSVRYARTPLTFQKSMIKLLFEESDDYQLYLPSQPNTNDEHPLIVRSNTTGKLETLDSLENDEDYLPQETSDYNNNVGIWDVPGIRMSALATNHNHSKYRDIYNTTLADRIHSLRTESNAMMRLIAAVYCLTSIKHWTDVKQLAIKNVPLPFHPMPIYIRGAMKTETAVMGIRGSETGQIWYSSGNYTTGVNVDNKWLTGSYTVWVTAIVSDPRRVEILYNIAPAQIEGGLRLEFYSFPSGYSTPEKAYTSELNTVPDKDRPSLICMCASPTEAKTVLSMGDFDLIGRSLKERFRNINAAKEYNTFSGKQFKLGTRDFYDRLWSLKELIEHNPDFGTFSSVTYFSTFDQKTNRLSNFHKSTSARKTGYGIGSADVWNGIKPAFPAFDAAANTINA